MPARIETEEGRCEVCTIFVGGREEPWPELTEYREHKLCGWCICLWKDKEERVGHGISWDKFRK